MKMIKCLTTEIKQNIHEAREKICIAYRLREKDKAVADWYKEMAAAHMAFNNNGHTNVTRVINDAKTKMAHDPLLPGMMAVYDDLHADIMRESAEVQAMIQNYK